MAKTKVSVTIEESVLRVIDRQAEKTGDNRSMVIERMCRSWIEDQLSMSEGKIEYFRLLGPSKQIANLFKKDVPFVWDGDCERIIELVLRTDPKEFIRNAADQIAKE